VSAAGLETGKRPPPVYTVYVKQIRGLMF